MRAKNSLSSVGRMGWTRKRRMAASTRPARASNQAMRTAASQAAAARTHAVPTRTGQPLGQHVQAWQVARGVRVQHLLVHALKLVHVGKHPSGASMASTNIPCTHGLHWRHTAIATRSRTPATRCGCCAAAAAAWSTGRGSPAGSGRAPAGAVPSRPGCPVRRPPSRSSHGHTARRAAAPVSGAAAAPQWPAWLLLGRLACTKPPVGRPGATCAWYSQRGRAAGWSRWWSWCGSLLI